MPVWEGTRHLPPPMPVFIGPCRPSRQVWPTSIRLWFFVCVRLSCFACHSFLRKMTSVAVLRLRSNDPLIQGFRKGSMSMIKIITIEREYGCGGGEIAQLVAK